MIQEEDVKLIAELNRIVNRFGPKSVSRLASLIRDPQTADEIATLLETAANMAPAVRRRPQSRPPSRAGMAVLNHLRLTDPEKHAVIAEFREQLITGNLLGSMSDIRHFARTSGLHIGKASSRNAAIAPLLRSLVELETIQIATLLDSLTKGATDDHSLERWRNLIVKPRSS